MWRAVILTVAFTAPAAAQDHGWDCKDYGALPQQGINACLADEFAAADAELNAVYQAAMSERSGPMADRLRQAQRLWIPYRDAACEAEAEFMRGGTGEPMMRLGCLVRLTETRTEELRMFTGF